LGERKNRPLRVNFDRQIQIEFHGVKVTSDAGLLAFRELDDALGLTEKTEDLFFDPRTGKNTRHSIKALIRQSIFSRLAGYEDCNDATRLRIDPAMRQVVGERGTKYNGHFGRSCYHPLFCFNQEKIEHLLTRPVGRPSARPLVLYHSFYYRPSTWNRSRRVVAKVEWHQGELFPRVGFVVTNMKLSNKNVIKFYNKRGTAEQWIKEGKYALKWTRLSCKRFKSNQVRLQLFSLAYNLSNFFRRLVLPREIKHWTLTTLRDKFIKIGAKVISHGRYVVFQMAEVTVSRKWMAQVLGNIHRLRLKPDTS
jgi:hypothetical protein